MEQPESCQRRSAALCLSAASFPPANWPVQIKLAPILRPAEGRKLPDYSGLHGSRRQFPSQGFMRDKVTPHRLPRNWMLDYSGFYQILLTTTSRA